MMNDEEKKEDTGQANYHHCNDGETILYHLLVEM